MKNAPTNFRRKINHFRVNAKPSFPVYLGAAILTKDEDEALFLKLEVLTSAGDETRPRVVIRQNKRIPKGKYFLWSTVFDELKAQLRSFIDEGLLEKLQTHPHTPRRRRHAL